RRTLARALPGGAGVDVERPRARRGKVMWRRERSPGRGSRAEMSGGGVELQRGRIDAVAEARRIRSIVEDVTEVPSTARARRLRTRHEERAVGLRGARCRIGRCEEARPASPRLELRVGAEELGVTA